MGKKFPLGKIQLTVGKKFFFALQAKIKVKITFKYVFLIYVFFDLFGKSDPKMAQKKIFIGENSLNGRENSVNGSKMDISQRNW